MNATMTPTAVGLLQVLDRNKKKLGYAFLLHAMKIAHKKGKKLAGENEYAELDHHAIVKMLEGNTSCVQIIFPGLVFKKDGDDSVRTFERTETGWVKSSLALCWNFSKHSFVAIKNS